MNAENMQIATIAVPLQEWQSLTNMVKNLVQKVDHLNRKEEKGLLTTSEVCKMLDISRSTLQRYLINGDIVPERIGSKLRSKLYIHRADVERIAQNTTSDPV